MSHGKHIAWLYGELPGLVTDGTLTSEAAEKLRRRYGEAGRERGSQAATLFGVLGAVLIGCGVILLIAYNWDNFGRATRAALGFVPLVLAQAIAAWALWRRPESTAWRESAGSFLTLAIGATIALVAQTYDIGGDLGDFLLTWTLLGLPVAYVMRATLPALLYLVGIAAWAGARWTSSAEALGYWGLLALVMPWWRLAASPNPYRPPAIIFAWLFALVLPFGVAASLGNVLDVHATWLLLSSAIAGALFLAGRRFWGEAPSTMQRPLQTLGALALVALGLAFTFDEVWRSQIGTWGGAQALKSEFLSQPVASTIVVLWLGGWLALWIDSFRCEDPLRTFLGATPVFVVAGLALTNVGHSFWAMLLFNAYLLALGVGVLLSGLRAQRLGTVNGGMLILAAVILFRFFDVDLGFLPRAVAFIILGAGFLGVNAVLARRRGVAAP